MKRVSPKRAALNQEAEPWRTALKTRVGRCELCGRPAAPEYLDCDEIARGQHRARALTAEYAILVVERLCHGKVQLWTVPKRLALLYLRRSSDYCLESYWKLTQRRWPEQAEVDVYIQELLIGAK